MARIRRAIVVSPKGRPIEFSSRSIKAYVIDRAGLDELLIARARAEGVEVARGVAAVGLSGDELATTAGRVRFSVLVGADGVVSQVANWAGLPRPRELLVGVQAVVAAPAPTDAVEVHLGRGVAPGFFAWVVPAGDRVRVGLATCDWRAARGLLVAFLSRRFPAARVGGWTGGLIPIGPPEKTVSGRVLLVGDAAGQVKPISGGGLYFGTVGARLAGEAAARGPEALPDYERRWREELGEEISFGLAARRVFLELTDPELDRALAAIASPRLVGLLADRADIDYPSRLLAVVRSSPGVWGPLLAAARALGGIGRLRRLVEGLPG